MSDQAIEKKCVSLHLGCGKRYIPLFTYHIDAREFPYVDYVTSVDKLGMFENNSVDLVYSCHVLEHFGRNKIEDVLGEWYRVLKIGGILRVAIPDFEKLVEVYNKTKDIKLVLGSMVGRQDYPENTHYVVFDFTSLSEVLTKVGFKNIHRYDWRETIHKDYDDYSRSYVPRINEVAREDYEKGTLISLNVECNK
jgi:predicted SAM-dependent methyltransferase